MRDHNRFATVVAMLAFSVAGTGSAAAQSPGTMATSTVGVSLESWRVEDVALTMIAFHAGRIVDRRLGVDFTLAGWPRGVIEGGLLLVSDLGLGYGVVRDDVSASIRAGFSGVGVLGSDFGTLLPGVHAGATLVARTGLPVGIRLDAVFRAFRVDDTGGFLGMEVVPTLSLGFGVTRVRSF